MPSTDRVDAIASWLTAPETVARITAIVVAMPTAFAFHSVVVGTDDGFISGGFLLLMVLGIGVPDAFDDYGSADGGPAVVAWVLGAALVVTVEYTALYLAGTTLLDGAQIAPAIVAFLVTYLGNRWVLSARAEGRAGVLDGQ